MCEHVCKNAGVQSEWVSGSVWYVCCGCEFDHWPGNFHMSRGMVKKNPILKLSWKITFVA